MLPKTVATHFEYSYWLELPTNTAGTSQIRGEMITLQHQIKSFIPCGGLKAGG